MGNHPSSGTFMTKQMTRINTASTTPASCFPTGTSLPKSPVCGDDIRGVTKGATLYPVRIGNRDALLVDTPGIGDRDVKEAEILVQLQIQLQLDIVNGVLLCTSMPNSRLTKGQKFCIDLIDAAIDENCKWENFVLVGTKKDLFKPRAKDRSSKCQKWKDDMMAVVEEDCGGKIERCAMISLPSFDEDADAGVLDVGELVEQLCTFQEFSRLTYHQVTDEKLVQIMNDAMGETVVTAESLEIHRQGSMLAIVAGIVALTAIPVLSIKDGPTETFRYVSNVFRCVLPETTQVPLTDCVQIHGCNSEIDVCAVLSSVIYEVATKEELDEQLSKHFGDDTFPHTSVLDGDMGHLLQPTAAVLSGGTLYIAWRGTKTFMDLITDAFGQPVVSPLWMDLCGDIKVHAGMHAMVQHSFYEKLEKLAGLVEKYKVRKVVFTGHSLGGGLAQIALLSAFGQNYSKFSGYLQNGPNTRMVELFKHVNFTAKVFAAPMVFHFPAQLREESKAVVKELQMHSQNFVFHEDMVPRFPSYIGDWKDGLSRFGDKKAREQLGVFAGPANFLTGGIERKIKSVLDGLADEKTIEIMSGYHHTSMISHFELSSDGQVRKQLKSPTEFERTSAKFSGSDFSLNNLLAFHSICPFCVGVKMTQAQKKRIEELREQCVHAYLDDDGDRQVLFSPVSLRQTTNGPAGVP